KPASPQPRASDSQTVEGPGRCRRVPVRAARRSVIYFDAAYIAKCYLNEPGAERVREVAYGADGLASCELARLEFASILERHVRAPRDSPGDDGDLERLRGGRAERSVAVVWCDVRASGEDPESRPRSSEHGLRPIW